MAPAQTPSAQLQCAAACPPLQHAAARDQTRQLGTPSLCSAACSTNVSSLSTGGSLTHAAEHRSWQKPECSYPVAYNSEGPNRRPRPRGRQSSRREACTLARPFRASSCPKIETLIGQRSGLTAEFVTKVNPIARTQQRTLT